MTFRNIVILIVFISQAILVKSQPLYTNFRIHPSGSNQIEPSIVRHQTNAMIMFASAYTIRQSFRSEGVYVTTDGGVTWFGSDTCSGAPITNHGGDPGPVIDKNGRFILTHQGNLITGMYSNYSDNLGATWSGSLQIASGDQDKGSPGTDDVPTSTYYGRTYLAWTRYSTPFPIVISWTDNGAQSWTPYLQINNTPGGHLSQGPYVSVGPSGQVYVCWAVSLSTSPFTEDFIGFAVSSNGGSNWTVTENAYDCNGIKSSQLQPWGIRVNGYPYMDVDRTGGSRNGWIYIVESEKNSPPAGNDPDVIFHRSTNGGQSWSPGIRVNQDALNNGKVQIFPAIEVDAGGGLSVIYFDNRTAPGDSMGVYLSRSADGGNTWSDYKVNDHWFRPKPIAGQPAGNQGDNIGITSAGGKLWPVWMDDHLGVYQIWTAEIDINTIGIKQIGTEVPKEFKLYQNYPNPFNSGTKFKIDIKSNIKDEMSNVKLVIYDVSGKEAVTLINERLKPGTYEVEWNALDFPSGVYLYRLQAAGFETTKKMVVIK